MLPSSGFALRRRLRSWGASLALGVMACSSPSRAAPGAAAPELRAETVARALDDYRWFHQHPELSNQETQTAARLSSALRELGMEVREGVGGHGLLGVLRGGKGSGGPVVLYRADMDGLPVTEKTGLPYASQTPGVMHACGHDLHLAVALGALRSMHALRGQWSGTLLFVAQPAEELGAGAAQMLADPRFAELIAEVGKPRVAFALHDSADLPAGRVAVSGGYVTANVDSVDLTFHGKGGHGAKPHETIDPIVMASEAVMQLQTIVSRRVPPDRPAVVTVGQFRAGTKHNVIPPTAELLLTVRSYDDETRALLLSEIQHVAQSVADGYHAPRPVEFRVREGHTPSGLNDVTWSARLARRFSELLGPDQVVPIPPTMGGEDFARFGRQLSIPGVQWRLGAVEPSAFARAKPGELPGLHSDGWAPDAATALPVGIRTVVAALLEGLEAEGASRAGARER